MHKHKSNRKHKLFNLFLPAWLCVLIALACIVTGILIGNQSNKYNNSGKESISSLHQETNTSKPKIDKTQWNLILVNKDNPLPDDYNPTIKQLQDGHGIDERAYPDLQDMLDACRADGYDPMIYSSYRTMSKQKKLYNNKINQYINQGYSKKSAIQAAGEIVAVPGTSEHQLGLALDIVDRLYQVLDENQENTQTQKWLMNNSWKYGFILRYPTDKRDITGITYEPWHYRYVGKKAAKEIFEAGLCLEEYLNN